MSFLTGESRSCLRKFSPSPYFSFRPHNPPRFPIQLWSLVRFLLDEFEPWLKWLVFDAVLRMVVGWIAARNVRVRQFLTTIGLYDGDGASA